jgi:hypothetical protein
MAIAQEGSSLSGTATIDTDTYTLTGTARGSSMSVSLIATGDPSYVVAVIGTKSGATLSGTWEDNDPVPAGGSFSLTRL